MNQSSAKRAIPDMVLIAAVALTLAPLRIMAGQASYVTLPISFVTERRIPDSAPSRCWDRAIVGSVAPEWDTDPVDAAEDSIDAQVLAPGSGMVAVDSHGRLITAGDATARDTSARPTESGDCCPSTDGNSGPRAAPFPPSAYTTSKGRDLARCAGSMKPPPSNLSPL